MNMIRDERAEVNAELVNISKKMKSHTERLGRLDIDVSHGTILSMPGEGFKGELYASNSIRVGLAEISGLDAKGVEGVVRTAVAATIDDLVAHLQEIKRELENSGEPNNG